MVIASYLILHEQVTFLSGVGTALTLIGLLLSEGKEKREIEHKSELAK